MNNMIINNDCPSEILITASDTLKFTINNFYKTYEDKNVSLVKTIKRNLEIVELYFSDKSSFVIDLSNRSNSNTALSIIKSEEHNNGNIDIYFSDNSIIKFKNKDSLINISKVENYDNFGAIYFSDNGIINFIVSDSSNKKDEFLDCISKEESMVYNKFEEHINKYIDIVDLNNFIDINLDGYNGFSLNEISTNNKFLTQSLDNFAMEDHNNFLSFQSLSFFDKVSLKLKDSKKTSTLNKELGEK